MTLAVKSRIWQLGKEKNEVTMGIAPILRHCGKRPVNPNPGNTRMDGPFCENTRETKCRRESGEDAGMAHERVEEELKRRAVEVSEKWLTPKELEQFREAKDKDVTNL